MSDRKEEEKRRDQVKKRYRSDVYSRNDLSHATFDWYEKGEGGTGGTEKTPAKDLKSQKRGVSWSA